MRPFRDRTGIEIHVGPRTSDGPAASERAPSSTATDAVIIVDGARRVEPLRDEHFVDVGPGEHDVEMFVQLRAPSSDNVVRALRSGRLRVRVTSGHTTVLRYTQKDILGASLALATAALA